MSLYDAICEAQKEFPKKHHELKISYEQQLDRFFDWFRTSLGWKGGIKFRKVGSAEDWSEDFKNKLEPTRNRHQHSLVVKLEWVDVSREETLVIEYDPYGVTKLTFLGLDVILSPGSSGMIESKAQAMADKLIRSVETAYPE